MTRRLLLCGLAALMMACDQTQGRRLPLPTQPSPNPAPAPTPGPGRVVRPITVGEELKDTFSGFDLPFEFTAPADGRFVARLTWDVWFNGSLMTLQLGDTTYKPSPPDWSPVVGTWSVTRGQTYRLIVGPGGTDWFYNDAFVLTTSLE
jgi:hypothetical protein